ncbi:GNAT family N-acetyltransferase [Belnapia moabensis]|uniref:GNAT family N-acetyltransferase n=1 Tax=Belnapia moabensis TaxID=365533 RepID=UPI000AA733B3|nr:GNAT family N-acetyltransferase [Belnapia moabensis]
MMSAPLTLEGPRLRLRPWRAEDRAPLAAINADPAVMRYFPAPMSRAESDAWLDRIEAHFAEHGWGFWAVEHKSAPGLIGAVGLLSIPWQADFTPGVEIGWRIATAHQRQGYAEEAARLSLAAGFGRIGLSEIVAFTVPGNAPSWLLMAKLGMRPTGTFEHPRLAENHPLRLHLLYRMSRQAWMSSTRPERATA